MAADQRKALIENLSDPKWIETGMGGRLRAVFKTFGFSKLARAVGKSEKQLRRYADGTDIPAAVVSKVAQETGIDVIWLMTGRQRMQGDEALSTPKNMTDIGGQEGIDDDSFEECIKIVEQIEEDEGLVFRPRSFAKLVVEAYKRRNSEQPEE